MKKLLLIHTFLLFLTVEATLGQFTGKPQYQITTKRAGVYLGTIDIELFPTIAPKHVRNFDSLVSVQFFDSTAFHRVIPGFMIQGGDPNSRHGAKSTWGYGDPSQPTVPAEFTAATHIRGRLSAARDADTNSANSQFFICVAPASWLNGEYSVYGQVTAGMNIADSIVLSPRDSNDNPLQKIEMFITYTGTNNAVPTNPNLTSPADYSVNIPGTQALKWTAVTDVVLYALEVSDDSTFSTFTFKKEVAGLQATISNLQGNKTYYWRVRSNNGGNYSNYSNIWRFNTQTGPATLVLPVNTALNVSIDPVFEWEPVPNADSYRLQVSKNSTFATAQLVFNQNGITSTSRQVTGLLPNTFYYWRVRSISGTVEGFFSDKWTFTTGNFTSLNNFASNKEFSLEQNIPNPVLNQTTINYSVPVSDKVILKLYDVTGRELAVLVNEFKDKGEYSYQLKMDKYSAGIYFYKLETGNYSLSKKLIRKT